MLSGGGWCQRLWRFQVRFLFPSPGLAGPRAHCYTKRRAKQLPRRRCAAGCSGLSFTAQVPVKVGHRIKIETGVMLDRQRFLSTKILVQPGWCAVALGLRHALLQRDRDGWRATALRAGWLFSGFDRVVRISLQPSSGSAELWISSPLFALLPLERSPQICRGLLWRVAVFATHTQLTVMFGCEEVLLGELVLAAFVFGWGAGCVS